MTLSNQSPAQGATGVYTDVSPSFRQDYPGVFSTTIDVYAVIDGGAPVDVIVDGVFQAGWSGTVTDVSDNIVDVVINPDADFPANVLIELTAMLEDTLSFTTGSGPDPGGGGGGGGQTQACVDSQNRLIQVLKQPRIQTLLCLLSNQAQQVTDANVQVLEGRSIETGEGVQLDQIGVEYRLPRNAVVDATYRTRLRALAKVASSRGTGDELLAVLTDLDDGAYPSAIALLEHFPAAFIMTFQVAEGAWLVGQLYSRLLRRAKQGGNRLVAMFEEDRADLFVWDDEAGNGWQDEDDPDNTGGVWAEGMS